MNRIAFLLATGAFLAATSSAYAQNSSPGTEAIDEMIAAKWEEAGIKQPAKRANDHEFLRRVFIDLIGRIATTEEVLDFESDRRADKRARLVKRLLYETEYQPRINGAPAFSWKDGKKVPMTFNYAQEYSRHWANVWTVWLMTRSGHPLYRDQMRFWLEMQFEKNRPFNDIVVDLITANGASNENGAVNFIIHHLGEANPNQRRDELGPFDAVPITSRVTKTFLGLQTQCIQCHDHPFNPEWVQADFWGVNAFFRQTNRSANPTPGPTINNRTVDNPIQVTLNEEESFNPNGVVYYERRDGKLMAAKPNFIKDMAQAERDEVSRKTMQNAASQGIEGKTRREILAQYVIRHDNFAPAFVNRIWGQLFGRGLNKDAVVDDFGSHNPVVHPELLARLGEEFTNYNYDPKMLLEMICNSKVYNLSHEANPQYADPKFNAFFARMPLKAMSPEVLFESLMVATRGYDKGSDSDRRTERERWLNQLVRNFGDDEGNEMTFSGTVIQALLMMNGRDLNNEISRKGNNVVEEVVKKYTTRSGNTNPQRIIDELFIMTLNRHATSTEVASMIEFMKGKRVVTIEVSKPEAPQPKRPNRPAPKGANQPDTAKVTGALTGSLANDVTFYQDLFWALLNTNEFILNH